MSSSVRPRRQYEAEIDYPASVVLIEMILRYALSKTIDDLEEWIDEFVPKRTGQLRDSLKKNLRSSRVISKTLLKLYFGTHLDYATFVNDMTTGQVAHDGVWGYAYYYGDYGKIKLDDPNAIGKFFDRMINYARLSLTANINLAIHSLQHLPLSQGTNLINYVVVRRT